MTTNLTESTGSNPYSDGLQACSHRSYSLSDSLLKEVFMSTPSLSQQLALVTGASSGIGKCIATSLASRGANLVLVARNSDALHSLKDHLEKTHNISVHVMAMDLTHSDQIETLFQFLDNQGLHVDILINNAGFGLYGDFVKMPWQELRSMLELNIIALTQLTWELCRRMQARNTQGYILQVSSVTALYPTPLYALYGASKALVRSFSEALSVELIGSGISCTTVLPGATRTHFMENSHRGKESWVFRMTSMTAESVAEIAVKAMLKRKTCVVPGLFNRATALFTWFLPRKLIARIFKTVI